MSGSFYMNYERPIAFYGEPPNSEKAITPPTASNAFSSLSTEVFAEKVARLRLVFQHPTTAVYPSLDEYTVFTSMTLDSSIVFPLQ